MCSLYKTTIVVWSEFDPTVEGVSLSALASEAETGEAYCSALAVKHVSDPASDPDWDGTEFFGGDDEEDEEE